MHDLSLTRNSPLRRRPSQQGVSSRPVSLFTLWLLPFGPPEPSLRRALPLQEQEVWAVAPSSPQ